MIIHTHIQWQKQKHIINIYLNPQNSPLSTLQIFLIFVANFWERVHECTLLVQYNSGFYADKFKKLFTHWVKEFLYTCKLKTRIICKEKVEYPQKTTNFEHSQDKSLIFTSYEFCGFRI